MSMTKRALEEMLEIEELREKRAREARRKKYAPEATLNLTWVDAVKVFCTEVD